MVRSALFIGVLLGFAVPDLVRSQSESKADLYKQLDENLQKAKALNQERKYAEALPFAERAAELGPKVFGPDHANTAQLISGLGVIYQKLERTADAEKACRASLAIREKQAQKNPKLFAKGLADLSIVLRNQRKYDEALPLLKRCLEIEDEILTANDPGRVSRMIELATVCTSAGRHRDAEPVLRKCLELQETIVGAEDKSLITTLNKLSAVCCKLAKLREAEALGRRSVRIIATLDDPEHPQWVDAYTILADACTHTGKGPEAETIFRRCVAMREKGLGKDHPLVARSLTRLATHLVNGQHGAEPEAILRRSLAIQEKALGPNHPDIAGTLLTLGQWLDRLGKTEEAERHVRRSVAILELNGAHLSLGAFLQTLGRLQAEGGRDAEAERSYRRSYEILAKTLGPEHHETVAALSDVARSCARLDRLAEAAEMQFRCVEIARRTLPPLHPSVNASEHNLAQYYVRAGRLGEAAELLDRCLKNAEATQGKESEAVGRILATCAKLEYKRKNPRQAVAYQSRVLELDERPLRNVFGFASEATMLSYLQTRSGLLPSLLVMAEACGPNGPAAETACTWTLRHQGAVFDTICRYQQARSLAPDPDFQKRLDEYRALKQRVADAALKSKSDPGEERKIERLESELNDALSRRDRSLTNPSDVTTAAVRAKLTPKSALVQYVYVNQAKGDRLMAFVVTPEQTSARLVDLGVAQKIGDQVDALRKEFDDFQEKLRECETPREAQELEKAREPIYRRKAGALYANLIAPLADELAGAELLHLVTDGALHRLPFEALVDDNGKYLAETRRCTYLSSGRDLLRPDVAAAKGVAVFAGPDFKVSAAERQTVAARLIGKKDVVALRGQRGVDLRSAGWKPLPGAAGEADDIRRILAKTAFGPVKTYTGAEAMEEVLKVLPPPRILHLATHGFYLDHQKVAAGDDDVAGAGAGAGAGGARGRLKKQDNPLLRSGIVLAGANTIGDRDDASNGDDGWVTAEEIALLNLRGAELVVLSACQTGLGEVRTGEGVFGLRRAFLYAGARSLLTSLFEVPDNETRDLMQRFYQGLKSGHTKSQALSAAQRGMIDRRRQNHGAAHPFYWASFVLIGDPR